MRQDSHVLVLMRKGGFLPPNLSAKLKHKCAIQDIINPVNKIN